MPAFLVNTLAGARLLLLLLHAVGGVLLLLLLLPPLLLRLVAGHVWGIGREPVVGHVLGGRYRVAAVTHACNASCKVFYYFHKITRWPTNTTGGEDGMTSPLYT